MAIGCVDAAGENAAAYVGDQSLFAAVITLAAVRAPVLENARGQFDALAVHVHERRQRCPLRSGPVGPIYPLVEPYPGSVVLPAPKIVVHRRSGGEGSWQAAPLTTNSADIAHGVNSLPQAEAAFAWQGQQQDHNLPLRVSKGLIAVNHKAYGSLGTPAATY